MLEERLLTFAKLWSEKNIDALMTFFTKDCIYRPSVLSGTERQFKGHKEVRKVIKEMMQFDMAVTTEIKKVMISGEFGFWEWEYHNIKNERVNGCDVFKFRKEFIVEKNAYRKLITKNDS